MQEEIKEILYYYQKDIDRYEKNMKNYTEYQQKTTFSKNYQRYKNHKILLDYITNLQEENVSLNNQLEFIGEQNKYIDKLENIIDELENRVDLLKDINDKQKEVLDKIKEKHKNTRRLYMKDLWDLYDYLDIILEEIE